MDGPADFFEFAPPAALVARAEQQLKPLATRMLPRTAALTVALVLLFREWLRRSWGGDLPLWPVLGLCALVVLPVLLVVPLVAIPAARRTRTRLDALGVRSASLPLLAETIPWNRIRHAAVGEVAEGFPALELELSLPLGRSRTVRFPFDPACTDPRAVAEALRRFAPPRAAHGDIAGPRLH